LITAPVARAHADHAEPASDEAQVDSLPANYRSLVELGFQEIAAGNYQRALTQLTQAQAIQPSARLLLALGTVEHALQHEARAAEYVQQALDSQNRPLTQQERADAQQLSQQLRAHVALYQVRVLPASAQLALDGIPLSSHDPHSVWLDTGKHVLEATAPGYGPARRNIEVEPGEEAQLDLSLPLIAPRQPAPAPVAVSRQKSHLYESPWLWVGLAVVATTAVITITSVTAGSSTQFEVGAPISTPQTPPGALIQLLRAP
jgi:hypothetical protein